MKKVLAAALGLFVALGLPTFAVADELGPVSKKLLAVLNQGGPEFVLVHHAEPKISKHKAVRDAVAQALTPGCPTGISLARTVKRLHKPAPVRGTLVWLVSFHPDESYAGGAIFRRHPASRVSANFAFVAINATSGMAVLQGVGGSSELPPWKPMPRCAYR